MELAIQTIHPMRVEDGTAIVDWDSIEGYAVRQTWTDAKGRRCTRFLSDAVTREEAERRIEEERLSPTPLPSPAP